MTIDLSLLPPPSVVEPLDFETVLATIKADVLAIAPELADVLALESEPATKLCEVFAYRELLLRARINNAARATMLAHAEEGDLDNLAALFGVQRLPGEKDARLRQRTQLSLEGYSTAGPTLSYVYHALSASTDVRDVWVDSPVPGTVRTVVLAEESEENPRGVPGQALLDAVQANISADDKRPLCDTALTVAAQVLDYEVAASLVFQSGLGPGEQVLLAAAKDAALAYAQEQFRLGYDITVSGLKAALRQPGVSRVNIISPPMPDTEDVEQQDILIAVENDQAARCVAVTVTPGGIGA
ncbi:baseplate assembly protein [Bordetella hinzii]|uniref:baseplate assembly protein n=1 Tax=Bordetella hinzii TaxID=103855 RepID=UPI0007648DDC|nr:baseplate J/gp47 family protein [Bordetella hinzii]KXA71047.1 hypothetical protein AXA74_20300 [Bordetella hinzii LMG 13501]VEH23134.1 Uncharacterized homolog of phage Mu protein gp47 [Bordetella hinzii]VEH23156.1 Uncharacterized homolog of phage Mu protein gp47 [Bordetella hinzii]